MPLASFGVQEPVKPEPAGLSQYSDAAQLASTAQAPPHAPVVELQMVPLCVPTLQSLFEVHAPHEPSPLQKGSNDLHAFVAADPSSPLQATQAAAPTSQSGVTPVQAWLLFAVHVTQRFEVALQAGVLPPQSLSVLQARHVPTLGPLATQTPARHCGLLVHVGLPPARPHKPSPTSHTPVAQARAATVGSLTPPGTAWPFGNLAWQAPPLHQ